MGKNIYITFFERAWLVVSLVVSATIIYLLEPRGDGYAGYAAIFLSLSVIFFVAVIDAGIFAGNSKAPVALVHGLLLVIGISLGFGLDFSKILSTIVGVCVWYLFFVLFFGVVAYPVSLIRRHRSQAPTH